MSANIASINGQSAIAYIGSTPWHGEGTRLRGDVRYSVEQFLAAAGLDWQVAVEPIFNAGGTQLRKGQVVRRTSDNRELAIVGPSYVPVQNIEAAGIFAPAIEQLGVSIEVAGALGDGEVCWALARLQGGDVDVTGQGDSVNGYALLKWGHDGSTGVVGTATGIRVVCQNTLALAASSDKATFAKVRHTKSAAVRVEQARDLFTGLTKTLIATGETFSQLASKRLTTAQIITYIESVFPGEAGKVSDTVAARRATVGQLVFNGVGVAQATALTGGDPNAWSVYNAVTEYFDHVRPAEAASDAGRSRANVSALFGGNADVKAQALVKAQRLLVAA
jgi:phage/plasmid-like protein (TIGR03299 family)